MQGPEVGEWAASRGARGPSEQGGVLGWRTALTALLPVSCVCPKLGSHSTFSGPWFAAEAEKEGLTFEVRDISCKGGTDFVGEFPSLERLSGPG